MRHAWCLQFDHKWYKRWCVLLLYFPFSSDGDPLSDHLSRHFFVLGPSPTSHHSLFRAIPSLSKAAVTIHKLLHPKPLCTAQLSPRNARLTYWAVWTQPTCTRIRRVAHYSLLVSFTNMWVPLGKGYGVVVLRTVLGQEQTHQKVLLNEWICALSSSVTCCSSHILQFKNIAPTSKRCPRWGTRWALDPIFLMPRSPHP